MPEPRRRLRTYFSTPPPIVVPEDTPANQHLETPQRSAVLTLLYYGQQKGIHINLDDINNVFNIPQSTASNVL